MDAVATTAPSGSTSSAWSKEAIFGLLGVLVMILCSALGFVWKCIVTKRFCGRKQKADGWDCRDLETIRRHQQEAYTASMRTSWGEIKLKEHTSARTVLKAGESLEA
ncbi:hypothetical protein K469DRAFT_681436 [Zopfia rhizophila CBS 207.26]|uniref:Uncharacterized protein n=1 Tax=Zopfia rhizophila CBS 207.26 TaxID=1314779 RepID=A0A6A6EU22_9PEZI|nr:hypothetical protein K469DRAFT_681436 [Zopfia rhizophila CBS 207.26]